MSYVTVLARGMGKSTTVLHHHLVSHVSVSEKPGGIINPCAESIYTMQFILKKEVDGDEIQHIVRLDQKTH